MKTPEFLSLDQVLYIHNEQIRKLGGSTGIRDLGLLQSALAMPQAQFGGQFLHKDLFEMAAAYVYHLTLNHPFIDGNKRVGAMAADVFLESNGYTLSPVHEEKFEKMVLEIAQGKVEKNEIAAFFHKHSRKMPKT
jgi:death-on-curing protein